MSTQDDASLAAVVSMDSSLMRDASLDVAVDEKDFVKVRFHTYTSLFFLKAKTSVIQTLIRVFDLVSGQRLHAGGCCRFVHVVTLYSYFYDKHA